METDVNLLIIKARKLWFSHYNYFSSVLSSVSQTRILIATVNFITTLIAVDTCTHHQPIFFFK